MNTVWTLIKRTKWFFISAIMIFFIAIGLSHVDVNHANDKLSAFSIIAAFVEHHPYFWIIVRAAIVLLFFFYWPVMVNRWAKQYSWPIDYAEGVKKRRWRYVVWIFVIDLTFQLL